MNDDKCKTCLRICSIDNPQCRACVEGSNWVQGPVLAATAAVKSCDTCSYVSVFPAPQHCKDCDDDLSGYEPSAVFDEERIDVVGANGNDGLHYGASKVADVSVGFIAPPMEDPMLIATLGAVYAKYADVSITDKGDVDNTAPGFLHRAAAIMDERGKTYDQAGGERSMGKTVAAFNAITGRDLTEAEGWLLMETLKNVRQWQRPAFHQDSADDGVAYSALKAEALARGV